MIHTSEIDSVVTTVGPVNTLNMPKPAQQQVAALSQGFWSVHGYHNQSTQKVSSIENSC